MQLSDREWKEFYIKDIFITENKKQVPTGAYINKKDLIIGNVPRITVTSKNNGVDGYWTATDKNYRVFSNFISVSFLGTIFYHPYKASLDMKVHCLQLINRNLNLHLSIFLISEIRKSIENASYGNQLSSTDLPNKKIMLPIEEHGHPDYAFMEDYVKNQDNRKRREYSIYAKKVIAKLEHEEVLPLNEKEWKPFFLTELFSKIQRGKRLKTQNHLLGTMPYVSSSALCNGVDNFISNTERVRIFSDCLSLANSGSVGSSFYEPFDFVASDHITHLKNEKFNKFHYLFIASITNRLSQKYNFNREINDMRISREKILLPVDDHGNPDYGYMEQYAKNLMLKKRKQYLDYIGV